MQKAWRLDGGGADDDIGDTVVEVALDRVQVTDAAAELHRDGVAQCRDDRLDRLLVSRLPGERSVQVHQMEPACALVDPVLSHGARILGEHRSLVHDALFQAHAMSVFQVNSRNKQHAAEGRMRIFADAIRRDGGRGSGS